MSKIEKQLYNLMDPVESLLEKTTNLHHIAILENFRRHVHLEGAGMFDEIVAPDMMADNPVYRINWGSEPIVVKGKEEVIDFYKTAGKSVLWHSDDFLAVGDWGLANEVDFHQLIKGQGLLDLGFQVDDPDKIYHYTSRQAFIWPYDEQGRLQGENLYEDKSTVKIVKANPADIITPARVAEIHKECLAKLDSKKPNKYWTLETIKQQSTIE